MWIKKLWKIPHWPKDLKKDVKLITSLLEDFTARTIDEAIGYLKGRQLDEPYKMPRAALRSCCETHVKKNPEDKKPPTFEIDNKTYTQDQVSRLQARGEIRWDIEQKRYVKVEVKLLDNGNGELKKVELPPWAQKKNPEEFPDESSEDYERKKQDLLEKMKEDDLCVPNDEDVKERDAGEGATHSAKS